MDGRVILGAKEAADPRQGAEAADPRQGAEAAEIPIYNRGNITGRDLAILKAELAALKDGFPAETPPRRELVDAVSSGLKLVQLENGLHSLAYWFYEEEVWRFPAHAGEVVRWWNLP